MVVGIVVDIIVLAFILISIFLGYKNGLVDSLVKILSFFIAIVLAFVLFKPVGNFIKDTTKFDETLSSTIENALSSNSINEEKLNEESDMPKVITDYVAKEIKNATATTQNEIAKTVAEKLTLTIINGISFIGIFLVARIVLFFVRKLADLFAEIPVIKQVNEIGGATFGLLRGLFVVYLLLAIISLLAAVIMQTGVISAIESSYVTSILYNNNLLLKIFF